MFIDTPEKLLIAEIYEVLGKDPERDFIREVKVTPYKGDTNASRQIAGVVITVAGSPPRATIIVPIDGSSHEIVCLGAGVYILDKYKKSTESKYMAVFDYLKGRGYLDDSNSYIGPGAA